MSPAGMVGMVVAGCVVLLVLVVLFRPGSPGRQAVFIGFLLCYARYHSAVEAYREWRN